MKIKFIILLLLSSNVSHASDPDNYLIIRDFVQYSSSIDAYSSLCIKNFEEERATDDLFSLIDIIQSELDFTSDEIETIKNRYYGVKRTTISQLNQIGLGKKKSLCKNYLKIFERFDNKKIEKLNEIAELIQP